MSAPSNPFVFDVRDDTKPFCNLTLRDYFAAAALQGLLAGTDMCGSTKAIDIAVAQGRYKSGNDMFSDYAYGIADSMLNQREKTK